MILNVTEDAEKQFPSCEALVKIILSDFMGLNEDVELMRAHHTTVQKSSRRCDMSKTYTRGSVEIH